METMTPRERIKTALRNQQPDRVPATPDISIMIPTKLSGQPSWDVEYTRNPSLQSAYISAAKHFGIDGWLYNGRLGFRYKSQVTQDTRILQQDDEQWEVLQTTHTPDGDLHAVVVYPRDNPCAFLQRPVKNFKEDFRKIRHLYSEVLSYDAGIYQEQRREVGEAGMICLGIWPPGLQNYDFMGIEELVYAYYDHPDLFAELFELHARQCLRMTEMAIAAGVESILTGGSGSITLQSPELFRTISFPTIQRITGMCRAAGVISGIHSCGKERYIVELCANESDLDYINPLEIPPMGDCDLGECKQKFGHKLALMGNLHTTDVMLRGSVADVRRACLRAIQDAGGNGGFVLSTGDQCGRDTPPENLFEMVRVAKEFGAYPLDVGKIHGELERLERAEA